MYCKYLLKRQRKYKPYFYCKILKKEIILPCDKNCLKRNLVANRPIKNKSNKQKQLEQKRYSIITNNFNKCYYCGKEGKMDLHEVFGGSNRKRSIKYGLVVPLCRICHGNENIITYLRIAIQKLYEKTHSREEFIKIFGKSYIKEEI